MSECPQNFLKNQKILKSVYGARRTVIPKYLLLTRQPEGSFFKLRFQEFFLAGFYFFEISAKSCARGSIFVKIFGRLRRPFFCHFFTVSPLINGQKPDFFSRAIFGVGFYFFEISTDCFSRGTIFLKSLSNLCPRY